MLSEFISTVYSLVILGKFAQLATYFNLIAEILAQPRAIITPGKPQPKD